MYICKECGEVFEEPITSNDYGCSSNCSPCCFGAFTNALECDSCGKSIFAGETGNNLCRECRHKALERFKYLLETHFTDMELQYIDRCVEGVSLCDPQNFTEME